ncbi:MAG: UDP-glucose/GDP-mannose dehydrogenase family protein [Chloroflexota bacterium]
MDDSKVCLADVKVCVIGTWHLGTVYSACLADLGYSVVGMDSDPERVKKLNQGIPPLFEPGLEDLLSRNLQASRLRYTTEIWEGINGARYILIAYDTPVNERDEVDLSQIWDIAGQLANHIDGSAVIVVSSQVPVGTCSKIKALIAETRPSLKFGIAYCPENLRLGQAIDRFKNPDRLVIGADDARTLGKVEALFSVIPAPKVRIDLRSAEMVKHALNAFLATSISFGNEIANLCDEVGADALKVMAALQLDERIGGKLPLSPGLGFAGGTLARDLKVIKKLGEEAGCATPLIDAVLAVNERQNMVVIRKLEKAYGNLKGLTIGVLGLTYKAGTSTLRRSAAIEIIGELTFRGARVQAYDPRADPEEVAQHREFLFCSDSYRVAEAADALLILTDWPEFKELDFEQVKSLMKKPFILDARNMLDGEALAQKGFIYSGIGRGGALT